MRCEMTYDLDFESMKCRRLFFGAYEEDQRGMLYRRRVAHTEVQSIAEHNIK